MNWSNWSGSVSCRPQAIARPASEDELCETVHDADRRGLDVRAAGSGHSFTPLCATDGVLVDLQNLHGVVSADRGHARATVWAGTRLSALGEPLLERGLALANQGDIDYQTIAGALATGTHGTGRALGSLSTRVAGLRLVNASGEIVECDATRDAEALHAGRVSLGALGILGQVTLDCVPAYRLHERTSALPFAQCVARMGELAASHRHFEFFWVPAADTCVMKALDPTEEPVSAPVSIEPGPPGTVERYLKPERVDWSFRIFPSERTNPFNEMEYAVPVDNGPGCLAELRVLMRRRHPDVAWPIEYRHVAADDIPLSPAHRRDVVTLSVHQDHALPHEAFFADCEALFRHHGGRPHWGKMHSLAAGELAALYPQWERFRALRARLDPAGRFLSPYVRTLLGETA